MKYQSFLLFVVLSAVSFINPVQACTGGSNAGTLVPTAAYQTQAVSNGQYYVVNVSCGSTYNFTFCSNGGTAAWDTQITINQTNNTTQIAYNDDACGLQSNVSWTATFNGTIHVLISLYSCNNAGGSSGTLAYNVTSTNVTYSASCNSANALIAGASGGTFSFNPAPGDAALINSSTGQITSATEGASYTVQYTYCGGTLNIPVTMGSAPCYTLNGNAQYINVGGENCIQLTAEVNNQTGCAWNDSQIDFATDFSLTLDYYFGNNINGADGNTFTFQPSGSTACGQNGGQLGAGAIPNSLSIEFDTYDNDNPTHLYDMSCDHIAVEIDGNMLGPGAPYCGPVCAKPGGGNIDDGLVYEVEIAWDATLQQLNIYFNGALRLSCSGDFVNTVFGGQSDVYWGATSATGGLNNQQYFCPNTVLVLPLEIVSFTTFCEEGIETFEWKTASERDLDYFELEYTVDGMIFYPFSKVKAKGNSEELTSYSSTISLTNDDEQRYYRLKTYNLDGSFDVSGLIAGDHCEFDDLLLNMSQSENELKLIFSEDVNLKLQNGIGQVVQVRKSDNQSLVLPVTGLSTGFYYLLVSSFDGREELHLFYIR